MRVFVNYRTDDSGSTALLISRFLAERIGEQNVFLDTRSIPPGTPFDDELLRNVWRSDVLVAVVGEGWLGADSGNGRAIDDPQDWIRRELVEALTHQVRVVPLLVGDARFPTAAELPAPLADLVRRQYVKLDLRAPDAGLARLLEVLDVPDRAKRDEQASGRTQYGGIGSIKGTTVNAITDPRGPVHLGDWAERRRGDT